MPLSPVRAVNEFAVCSAIELPGDAAAPPPPCDAAPITIRRASLAHLPSTLRRIRRQLVYDVGDGFLIEPHVGPELGVALHINLKADVMTIDAPDARLPIAAAWAIHAGLGAATLTHGGLPLHGAGLEIEGRRIGLMADSGVGKSTLSWFLLERGATFANDDLIPVYAQDDGRILAYPAVSLYPKLSREAVDRHGLDPAALPIADYGTEEEEYYAPLPHEKRVTAPAPLSSIFVLSPVLGNAEEADATPTGEVTVERLCAEEAQTMITANLHTVWLIGKYLNERKISARCATLAAQVPVYRLRYARSYAVLPQLREVILRTLRESV